ncbi:MAG: L-serine ammonia-lyase, iron-sulfur-dependent, subunit alpha [Clostridioides sp.]|jgi:L-cysteine desulfidase|nr:L-serine ammonia-lyase, iron-sulfur-dependent, subunit alpha [Clostridioides sp.]
MKDNRNYLIKLLREEVKPAVGCTEPVALALGCAKAKELLDEDIVENEIFVSHNIYKNGMGVGIPGTKILGLKIAAAMGMVAGHSENGLSVLETLSEEEVKQSEEFLEANDISITPKETKEKVFIEVFLKGNNNTAKIRIRDKHDNFTYFEKNGEVLFNSEEASANDDNLENSNSNKKTVENINEEVKKVNNESKDNDLNDKNSSESEIALKDMTIEEIIKNVENMNFEDIAFLIEGIEMNENMAEYGLKEKVGIGVGYGIRKSIEEGLITDDLINHAMMLTASASDARMSGIKLPVMSSNGSGNHGLTAILPIVAYNDKFPQTEEKLAKALAISHLVTGYIKNFTGRLSAVCGCGVAASTGACAGVSWLMECNERQIEGAIQNMIANLSGMICDGAKPGCALKLASAASAAMQSAIIAKMDCLVPSKNGIIGDTVEESIKNLGRVSDLGMSITDEVILDVMNDMNKVKSKIEC